MSNNIDIKLLETRIASLEEENKCLKNQLVTMALENSSFQHTQIDKHNQRSETRNKWEYYHTNKARVRKELLSKSKDPVSTIIAWITIKRITDKEYDDKKN